MNTLFNNLFDNNADVSLVDVLVVSRILFAIVMVGFIGYFFDRMKQIAIPVEKEVNTQQRQRR
jgi:ACR3 family arsenite efflux pump ArsB